MQKTNYQFECEWVNYCVYARLGSKLALNHMHILKILYLKCLQVFSYTLIAVYTIYSNVMHMHCLTMQRDQGQVSRIEACAWNVFLSLIMLFYVRHVSNALKTMPSTIAFEVTRLYFDVLGCKIMFINDFASVNSNNDNTIARRLYTGCLKKPRNY